MAKNTKKQTNEKNKQVKNQKKTTKKVVESKSKNKSYADNTKFDMNNETKKTIWTVAVVLIVLVVFYIITIYATGGSLFNSSKKTNNVEFQYNEILLGRSFDMGGNYFVLYYDKTDIENEQTIELNTLASSFKSNSSTVDFYTCDLGNSFNKPFVTTEEPNTKPYGAEDMLLNGPTLIRFSEEKVAEYINGFEDIKNYLQAYTGEQQ